MSQAMARHIDVNVLHLPGLARDIDEPADLRVLVGAARRARAMRFLAAVPRAACQRPDQAARAEEQ